MISAWEKWRRRSLPTRFSDVKHCKVSYAMNGEDIIADSVFGSGYPTGRYVDVGCFDPRKWSNTYKFYLRGWSGVCIDPNAKFQAAWRSLRPRDNFLNLAISTTPGEAVYLSKPGLPHENRIAERDGSHQADLTPGPTVTTDRLDRILGAHHPDVPLDLMSIDCEGHDLFVLQSNDFTRFRPRALIVEDHSRSPLTEIDKFCQAADYRLVGLTLFSKVFADARWLAARGQMRRPLQGA